MNPTKVLFSKAMRCLWLKKCKHICMCVCVCVRVRLESVECVHVTSPLSSSSSHAPCWHAAYCTTSLPPQIDIAVSASNVRSSTCLCAFPMKAYTFCSPMVLPLSQFSLTICARFLCSALPLYPALPSLPFGFALLLSAVAFFLFRCCVV